MKQRPFSLPRTLAAWNTGEFETVFKRELEAVDAACLPLQAGLSYSSSVADEAFRVVPIAARETAGGLLVKAGVFYGGLTGGCACSDDPTPLSPQTEYCVLVFEIEAPSGAARVALAPEE